MLNIQNLKVSFGDKEVLKGVDLTVNKGDVVTFIGPSGTGKTTILKCINYLVEPDEGQMQLLDVSADFKNINKKEILQLRRNTAMVFQQFNLFKNKTVVENVMDAQITVQKKSKKEAYEKSIDLLEKVGLLEKENEYPSRLSGGQQQRVSIARALAVEPEVILFDEPTSSLDPELVAEVLKVIESVAKTGVTILLVTHEMSFARKVSNKIVFMEKGKIVEEGSPEQIFENSQNERTKQFLKNYYAEAAEMMEATQ
ncbi:amino acid ABC transporter ATP-binding protein [Halobacillus shinanisalinarum]|uniref:Amino acid ABC transporter ATP-binding protein n=1 Tax=Halobacillus shinanisalinarum TaxID=2932258 RepID=A0ABY4H4S1_9BACI|nr:amino acid ABC transporter ATP-binding protein [Halobacillus shinanisalinarum]UOQ95114.1 amino acid ABC transporter ATP-binding protein [Halobacillus shinanisalinarum]